MKLVLNKIFGAFHLSEAALHRLAELKGLTLHPMEFDGWRDYYTTPTFEESSHLDPYTWDRTDPDLVRVVEELGELAGDGLEIRDLMTGQQYRIREYDGKEWLEFPSDIEWEVAT